MESGVEGDTPAVAQAAALRERVEVRGELGSRSRSIPGMCQWAVRPGSERVIGSIRRECLDHVIVLNERHLRGILGAYFEHYHRWRCHRSLAMDCPALRPVQGPELGQVVEVVEAGSLFRHYERRAA